MSSELQFLSLELMRRWDLSDPMAVGTTVAWFGPSETRPFGEALYVRKFSWGSPRDFRCPRNSKNVLEIHRFFSHVLEIPKS